MINACILAELLEGTVVPGRNTVPDNLDLACARLDSAITGECPADCLVVVDAGELDGAHRRWPGAALAVAGNAPESWDGERSLLVLPQAGGAVDALDRIVAVFDRFHALEEGMVRAVAAGKSANLILSPCAGLLTNPIALFDSTFTLIARTGTYDPEHTDAIWDEIEREGIADDARVTQEQLRRIEQSREPYLYQVGSINALQTCIRQDDRSVGFLGSTELYGPFTEGQVAIVWWISRTLEMLWPLIRENEDRRGVTEQVVLQIIKGEPVNRTVVARTLSRRSWAMDDEYRLLCFHRGVEDIDAMEQGQVRRSLERQLPLGLVLSYEGTVLVVLHGRDVEASRLEEPGLAQVMGRSELACAASDVQEGFLDLGHAYEQCEIIREACDGRGPGTVTTFSEAVIPCALHALDASYDLDALCHPRVRSLARRVHGSELVHSLRIYLSCGRNMSRAARELYVSRSTLVYRIEQIEGELGLDLNEADEGMIAQLYLSCAIVEGVGAEG